MLSDVCFVPSLTKEEKNTCTIFQGSVVLGSSLRVFFTSRWWLLVPKPDSGELGMPDYNFAPFPMSGGRFSFWLSLARGVVAFV